MRRLPSILSLGVGIALSISSAATAFAQNIVTNGSFEQPSIGPDTYDIFPSIPGWTDTSGCGIEIQSGVAGTPADGAQLVELDSNCSSTIVQTLTTVPGTRYQLQFDFSPRPGVADNHVQVRWGGAVVADLTADGTGLEDTLWTTHTVSLTATSSSTTLSFADLSVSDGLGTYIDDVRVDPAIPVPALTWQGLFAMGAALGLLGVALLRRAV